MGKYILVTGGELFNKGAQAMTFVTVSEIANRYPEKKVVLISPRDARREKEQKELYNIEFISNVSTKIQLLSGIFKRDAFIRLVKDRNTRRYLEIVKETDAMLDISGYALGANWGSERVISYMVNIVMACINSIPVYLMPQSFGPFSFSGKKGKIADKLLQWFMPHVKVIMAREYEGEELLITRYNLNNVVKTPDLVLQNKEINVDNIYRQLPEFKKITVKTFSVALIPNKKTIVYGNPEEIFNIYKQMIDQLLCAGKTVYLIYHAVEDYELCKRIKESYYSATEEVILCSEEYSCLEFDEIVKKFDFVIASRFHAIVHAYKNSIPAIVLGWAVKYKELVSAFGQDSFLFDVRKEFRKEDINMAITTMCNDYKKESYTIEMHLKEIQKDNVFDLIKL